MKFTKETWRRALRTFIQTAVSYLAVNLCVVDFTASSEVLTSALMGLVISAAASGLAAVMNLEKDEPVDEGESVEVVQHE